MVIRIGLGLKRHVHERLVNVCARYHVPQSRLVTAIVSVLNDEEILELLRRYAKIEAIETEIRAVADASMITYMKGRSIDDLQTMLNAAKAAEARA